MGDSGSGPHPTHPFEKSHKAKNTVPDPLKNHKATKPASNAGPSSARQRNAI